MLQNEVIREHFLPLPMCSDVLDKITVDKKIVKSFVFPT